MNRIQRLKGDKKTEKEYSYSKCLERSKRVNWTVDEILKGCTFDVTKRWLPEKLSAIGFLPELKEELKVKITQVEMASYTHLIGFVEEFIAPLIAGRSTDHAIVNRDGFDALTNFVSKEIKHMELFRAVRDKVNSVLGFNCKLMDNNQELARFVLKKSEGAVLLLTAFTERSTQKHCQESMSDNGKLDDLTKRMFKAHWLEESQHAQLNHLETVREFMSLDSKEKTEAAKDLSDLVLTIDSLLFLQTGFDIDNLERHLGDELNENLKNSVKKAILKAKRYTFIGSGVSHPEFQNLFSEVLNKDEQMIVVREIAHLL